MCTTTMVASVRVEWKWTVWKQTLGSRKTEQALCGNDTSRGVNYSLSYVCKSGYSFHKAAGS
jgi:hypothetical protein